MVNLLGVAVPFDGASIITTLVNSLKGMLTGLGSSVIEFFDTVFKTPEGGLTTFAIVSLSFIGISVATGICTWLIHMVRSK